MVIEFFSHEIDFHLTEQELVRDWLLLLVEAEGRELAQVTYIFCSDEYLLTLNREHLAHDYYTDILTFPYHVNAQAPIWSDMYISIDRVQENAGTFGVAFRDELHRVVAHGLLHLLGYDDHGEESERLMRSKEEEALRKRSF